MEESEKIKILAKKDAKPEAQIEKEADVFVAETENGRGVFAGRNFEKGETVIKFEGKLFTEDELPEPYNEVEDHYMQIGKGLYLGPSGKVDDFFNHSCDPNSGVRIGGDNALLFAVREIKKGEEITWDYSTTIVGEDDWALDCNCGSKNCRKKISDFKYLPADVREKYIALGIVPDYVIEDAKK